jgi:hypothetical protein
MLIEDNQIKPFFYSEPGGVPTISETLLPTVPTVGSHTGRLGNIEGNIFWQRQDFTATDQRVIEEINPRTGDVIERVRIDLPLSEGVPFNLISDSEFEQLFLQGPDPAPGLCSLQQFDEFDNSIINELQGIRCGSPMLSPSGFGIYLEQGGIDTEPLKLMRFNTRGITEWTNFSITVRDDAGNEVFVPVLINFFYSGTEG